MYILVDICFVYLFHVLVYLFHLVCVLVSSLLCVPGLHCILLWEGVHYITPCHPSHPVTHHTLSDTPTYPLTIPTRPLTIPTYLLTIPNPTLPLRTPIPPASSCVKDEDMGTLVMQWGPSGRSSSSQKEGPLFKHTQGTRHMGGRR